MILKLSDQLSSWTAEQQMAASPTFTQLQQQKENLQVKHGTAPLQFTCHMVVT